MPILKPGQERKNMVKGLVKSFTQKKTPDEPGKKSNYFIAQKKKVVKRHGNN